MASVNIDEWGLVRSEQEETEESYFVSMTDIMVGLLFIFIIMLMVFGLMLKIQRDSTLEQRERLGSAAEEMKIAAEEATKGIGQIQGADDLRAQMLHDIAGRLHNMGVRVIVREEIGVLHLPDEILFAKDEYLLSDDGRVALGHLARALDEVLPCYAKSPSASTVVECPTPVSKTVRLEAVFVEGHTDTDGSQQHNWNLSARRAISTFIELDSRAQVATKLRNENDEFLFSISGYGENRLVKPGVAEEDKKQNRRIDLRFVMNVSHQEALQRIRGALESVIQNQRGDRGR